MSFLISLILMFAQGNPLLPAENGTVSGVLRASTGQRASGVRVAATAAPGPGENVVSAAAMVSLAETAADGRYVLENIPPGRYYVTAGRVDLPTYYPGTVDVAAGVVITVSARQKLEGLDFTLQEASAGRSSIPFSLSGVFMTSGLHILTEIRVEGGGKVPVAVGSTYPFLRFVSPSGASQEFLFNTTTIVLPIPSVAAPSEYRVEVRDLPPGYTVRSLTYGLGADAVDLTKEPMRLSMQGLNTVQTATPLGTLLGGSAASAGKPLILVLARENAAPAAGASVRGTSTTATGEVYLSGSPGAFYADGSFEFSGVAPGRHVLVKFPAQGTASAAVVVVGEGDLDGIRPTALDLLPQDIEADSPRPANNRAPGILELPSIHGRILDDASGDPVRDGGAVTVGGYRNSRRTYAIDGDGVVIVPRLLTGTYRLDVRLSGYEPESQSVLVDDGVTEVTVRLRKTPAN